MIEHHDMGQIRRRYPVGIQDFPTIREMNYYYADKTGLMYNLVQEYNFVFLSRPRRFGKSLLVSTLASYFEGRKELFRGLKIEKQEKEWRKYPVIHLSFASVKEVEIGKIRSNVDKCIGEMERKYGVVCNSESFSDRMMALINGCYEKSGEKVVVLIDEYDAPLLNVLHDEETVKQVRQLMRTVFAPLKDCGPRMRFLFITGITKFSQLSIFSELNNLENISMLPRFATLCGITRNDMETVFAQGIEDLQQELDLSRTEIIDRLRQMYDGYHFSRNAEGVYNPFSLCKAFKDKELKQHWFATGTPSFIVEMLQRFKTDITKIDGEEAMSTQFDIPTEEMQSVLPLFYQSGYITIKDYDKETDIYTLGYPNKEVRLGINNILLPFYVSRDTDVVYNNLLRISRFLKSGDLDTALQTLKVYLKQVPYQENANSEGHYTSMLYVVFSLLGFHVESQVRTSDGRIDIVLKTPTCVYVMELKIDRPAKDALAQINTKDYLLPYSLDGRQLVKVGLSFSTQTRTLEDWTVEK